MDKWTKIPDQKVIDETVTNLTENGMEAFVVENADEAKSRFSELVPEGSEVFTVTSVTLDTIGISELVNGSSKYGSVRNKLNALDPKTQKKEMKRLGTAPDYVVGSVHALTQSGKAMIVSNTGSQLAAEVYGADHVIFVVGAQKIVKDEDEGFRRIHEYVLPLESERANKAYKITTGSFVSKLLTINREVNPNRIKIIIVKEVLGF